MITANKGEWAELYAFFKVISQRNIPLADENLSAIDGSFITFLNVHRTMSSGKVAIFHLGEDSIKVTSDEFAEVIVPVAAVSSKTASIFDKILENSGAFVLPEAEELMQALHLHSVKAPSAQKADLIATILDRSTQTSDLTGFSTKSFLGASATLLNAGPVATNFRYRVCGLDPELVVKVNEIETRAKVRDRLNLIAERGGTVVFDKLLSSPFERNLRKIDTLLPEFISHMLLAYYSGRGTGCTDLVMDLANANKDVQRYNLSYDDLSFKLKQLLVNIALGLVPNTPWDGMQKAHGGYLIVKRAGDVVCYHAIHRDKFLHYLFNATKFDTPSTTRHNFGSLYVEDSDLYLNLNLQIRFK
jgi:hypothetical protein